MHLKKEYFRYLLLFLLGLFGGVILLKSSVFQNITTSREKKLILQTDSLRLLLLTERATAGLASDRLKIATNDFTSDQERNEIEAKVFLMEAKILP